MRYIPLRDSEPPQDWRDKAADLLQQLQEAGSHEDRCRIIDDNAQTYRELRDWLLTRSHGKCWFSEAKDLFSHWDVEHYRPKKEAKDLVDRTGKKLK